jgi:hypothetical protein
MALFKAVYYHRLEAGLYALLNDYAPDVTCTSGDENIHNVLPLSKFALFLN